MNLLKTPLKIWDAEDSVHEIWVFQQAMVVFNFENGTCRNI